MGFFDLSAYNIERGDEKSKAPVIHNCKACGRFRDCSTPKASYVGNGKKGILVVGPEMTSLEDHSSNEQHGTHYRFLKKAFNKVGIDIEDDCWYTHSIRCHSKAKIGAITSSACHRMLIDEIRLLKPRIIVTTCQEAFDILLYDRMAGRASNTQYIDWCGELIPDQVLRAWIAPVYPTSLMMKEQEERYNKYELYYQDNFRRISRVSADCPAFDVDSRCHICTNERETKEALKEIAAWDRFAFDYETTGLKPHRKGHEIVYISASNGEVSYAFKSNGILDLWAEIMTNDAVKIAHNQSFERSWTENICHVSPNKLIHDTMLIQHCLHNRKPTGLKFITYARLGILGYDADSDEYLKPSRDEQSKCGSNGFNRIKKAPPTKMMKYNAMDSLFTYWLYEMLIDELHIDHQLPGYKFFIQGQTALDKAHENGMRVDEEIIEKSSKQLARDISKYETLIMDDPLIRLKWDRGEFNPKSDLDLRHLLFDILGYEVNTYTKQGLPSVDADALLAYKDRCELANHLLKYRKWSKALNTYMAQNTREVVDGKVRGFFSLNGVVTYRSCVAKGTKILAAQDFIKHPKGVPIEQIKEGDFVYSFDDNLHLTIKKVLWAGKTGNRKVVRLFYRGGKVHSKELYVDVTPEHLIRTITGEYVEAQRLVGYETRDLSEEKSRYLPKTRVLSCARTDARLFPTGEPEKLEHRTVYEYFSGETLTSDDVIHHKDGNHFNHDFANLQKMDNREHGSIHVRDSLLSPESRAKNVAIVKQMHKDGLFHYPCGKDSHNFLNLTRTQCLRQFVRARGKIRETEHDFNTYLSHCSRHSLDVHALKIRYNSKGEYLSRGKVIRCLNTLTVIRACRELGMSYYKTKMLCEHYGINTEEFFGKSRYATPPWRKATINNHIITGIEWLNDPVDVYDIEVEDTHNFIANEICVHNCSRNPNQQNIPKRDKETMKIVRSVYVASPGHRIIEYDFKGAEVSCAAAVTGDKNLIKYVSNPDLDMHRDLATGLFLIPVDRVNKVIRGEYTKGPWTFAQFYGSWYKQCADNIWQMLHTPSSTAKFGFDIVKHLEDNGIESPLDWEEHCKKQEKVLWDDFFPGYQEFRNSTFDNFQKKGYIDFVDGFRYYGPATRNECLNAPVQGPAFHIQLWAFTQITKEIEKRKMKSKLIGSIHDSMVVDVAVEEEAYMDHLVYEYATQKVREHWDWITVPLMVEKERSEVNGDWSKMESCGFLKGGMDAN